MMKLVAGALPLLVRLRMWNRDLYLLDNLRICTGLTLTWIGVREGQLLLHLQEPMLPLFMDLLALGKRQQ